MKILSEQDYKSFKIIAKMSEGKLLRTLKETLKQVYGKEKVIATKDWIVAKGEIPIALVAHLDTVFNSPPIEIYYDREQGVIWSPQGLGADDRAGVFSIFKIISDGYKPHIIFTTEEEWGGIGARNLAMKSCPFEDLRYIIELDRANKKDCVFYDCSNDEFQKYIEQFGFKTAFGTFSDISELCPIWNIAGVNLSIGYVNEHSFLEVLHTSHMLRTIVKVENMLSNVPKSSFDFGEIIGFPYKCDKCGKISSFYTLTPIYDKKGHAHFLCGDCITNDNVEWCESCYEGYFKGILNQKKICPICEKNKVKE